MFIENITGESEPMKSLSFPFLFRQRRMVMSMMWGVVLLLAGCGAARKMTPVPPFLTNLAAWPEMYHQNFQQLNTFVGKARLTVESSEYSGNVDVETYWVRPDKFYMQAEGFLGLDIGKVFVGSSRFIIYDQYSNHFVSGNVDDPYLNRFLQTDFTLKEVRQAALGQALEAPNVPIQLVDEQHGIFEAETETFLYRYLVNPRTGLLETCEVVREGRVFMRQDFRNYQVLEGVYFPRIVRITLPEQKQRISLFYKSLKINVPIDPQKYTIEVEPKVQQLNLN